MRASELGELTEPERLAGFVLANVKNPRSYACEPGTVPAVVARIDESHRVIKMEKLDGTFGYKLQVYGRSQDSRPQMTWHPVGGLTDDTPEVAIANAKYRIAQAKANGEYFWIPEAAPATEFGED